MRHLASILLACLVAGLFLARGAWAQPRPAELLRGWLDSQQERLEQLSSLEVHEDASLVLDGPFGSRALETTARVVVRRPEERWERDILAASLDGRPVPPERWEMALRHRTRMVGPRAAEAIRSVVLLPRALRDMRPAGRPERDEVDGRPVWRYDLVSRTRSGPVERVALWLTPTGRLVQSRVVAHARPDAPPLVVTTWYDRLEGLDLPVERHIEGTAQTRRRMRTFTMLFDYEATYRDYRLEVD